VIVLPPPQAHPPHRPLHSPEFSLYISPMLEHSSCSIIAERKKKRNSVNVVNNREPRAKLIYTRNYTNACIAYTQISWEKFALVYLSDDFLSFLFTKVFVSFGDLFPPCLA
jgi:hypothetical protein